MGYTVEPINVTTRPNEKVVDPRSNKGGPKATPYTWWLAQNDKDLLQQFLSTVEFLKMQADPRIKQASIYSRLFCGKPLYNFLTSTSKLDSSDQLPMGRPTANVVYSCTDALVSRLAQDKPLPVFLTEGVDYRKRNITKQANSFIQGEIFRTKAHSLVSEITRHSCVLGTGLLKIFPFNNRVNIETTLETELLVDYNDGFYGHPRRLVQRKLVDRSVYLEMFPHKEEMIVNADHGNADNSPKSIQTTSDQFIIAEGWSLPSFDGADDGRHVIACSRGIILDDKYKRDTFPFTKLIYNPNIVGYFGQSLAEILFPTQMEIYRQLIVGSQNFELMGVPRVLVEEMSKILETSFNNRIGSIIKYRNTPPEFVNAQANSGDWMPYVQFLIGNAYQMSGISAMSAAGTKPAGLNSGEAIRQFDQVQEARFAAFEQRVQDLYPELAYQIIDCASDIYKETGKYSTIYPSKDGIELVDFKRIKELKNNYLIQCFNQSSLPKDPAGRQARLSEMFAAQEISRQEFRRLSRFPDLEQSDQLAVALEERILCDLDSIVEDGEEGYKEPDPFILDDSDMATRITVQYINKYSVTNIEPEKLDLMRTYFTQIQDLKAAAQPPQQPQQEQSELPIAPPAQSQSPTSGVAV